MSVLKKKRKNVVGKKSDYEIHYEMREAIDALAKEVLPDHRPEDEEEKKRKRKADAFKVLNKL